MWHPERLAPGLKVEFDPGEAFAMVKLDEVVPRQVCRRGRIGILLSALDEARSHGILLDVEQSGAVVRGTERQR